MIRYSKKNRENYLRKCFIPRLACAIRLQTTGPNCPSLVCCEGCGGLQVLSFYHTFNELEFQIILSEIAIITALIEAYSVCTALKELCLNS